MVQDLEQVLDSRYWATLYVDGAFMDLTQQGITPLAPIGVVVLAGRRHVQQVLAAQMLPDLVYICLGYRLLPYHRQRGRLTAAHTGHSLYPNAVTVELPTSGSDVGTIDLYYFAPFSLAISPSAPARAQDMESQTRTVSAGGGWTPSLTTSKW